MKFIITTFVLSFVSVPDLVAQNPLGVYLDIDGKIKLWESEATPNGNIDDTVYITCGDARQIDDLRNLRYFYLTILEAPNYIYGTSFMDNSNDTIGIHLFRHDLIEPLPFVDTNLTNTTHDHLRDDIRGDGLNDSTIEEVKAILIDYINQYYGKWEPDDARYELIKKLSGYDSVIDEQYVYDPFVDLFVVIETQYVYDYLVDLFVTHDYDSEDHLTRVIGYHWYHGIEVDNLKYNDSGHLIYFSRESIGSIRNEYHFEYNEYGQVSNIISYSSRVGHNIEAEHYINPSIQNVKFTYNSAGIVNSKSELQKDGNWLTCYFEIK